MQDSQLRRVTLLVTLCLLPFARDASAEWLNAEALPSEFAHQLSRDEIPAPPIPNGWRGVQPSAEVVNPADGTWSEHVQGAPSGIAVFDSPNHRLLVFPSAGGSSVSGGTWSLDLNGPLVWRYLATQGQRPAWRYWNSAIYDSRNHRMVVFGGKFSYLTAALGDCWMLSLDAVPTWTQLPAGPAARYGHTAVYDSLGNRMIVFGGGNYEFSQQSDWWSVLYDDCWSLDLSPGGSWTRFVPSGTGPSRRVRHSSCWDPVRQRMWIFGGSINAQFDQLPAVLVNDLWALDLGGPPTWIQVTPSGPSPERRYDAALFKERGRERLLMLGGRSCESDCGDFQDCWQFDLIGAPTWSRLPIGGIGPMATFGTQPLDDEHSRILVYRDSLWSLSLGDSLAWRLEGHPSASVGNGVPGNRQRPSMIYDDVSASVYVFGGDVFVPGQYCGPHNPGRTWAEYSDTWRLPLALGSTWVPVPSGEAISGRSGCGAILDAARHRFVVFGGRENTTTDCFTGVELYLGDTWSLNLDSPTAWVQHFPTGLAPAARAPDAAIYDGPGDRMVILGGSADDDVWALNFSPALSWERIPTQSAPPANLGFKASAWDPIRRRILVFGLNQLPQVWALALSGAPIWQVIPTTGDPPVLEGGARAAFDSQRDRLLIYAGGYSTQPVWELPIGSLTWRRLDSGGAPPPNRFNEAVAYSSEFDELIVYAGAQDPSDFKFDLWKLEGDRPVPVQVSMVSREVTTEAVDLVWQVSGDQAGVTAERWREGDGWHAFAALESDGQGRLHLEDRDVQSGTRYGYRLKWMEGSSPRFGGETWVEVPAFARLSIESTIPSPALGAWRLRFTLASHTPAALEIYDVRGRRRVLHTLANLAPGAHEQRSNELGSLEPGIYWAVLTQGAERASRRIVVLQ